MEKTLSQKTLLLLDGNAIVHRGYHALPPLATKAGEPVGAVYGFAMTLLSVLEKFKPAYVASSFDVPKPTFRHKAYAEYKATRVKAPDDLYAQIPISKEVVRAFGIPIFEMEGFEADDVVGTLARQAESEGMRVVIVTGDMDTLQLVTDNVSVFTMKRGIKDTVLYDAQKVFEKYGLTPDQLPDFKGLRGDPSDNIPGVKGIGEKTASQLLQKYETLEGVYAHLDDIKGLTRDKLARDKTMAIESKMLGTIRTDVPIEANLADCGFDAMTRETDIRKIFTRLEFFSLLGRLTKGGKARKSGEKSKKLNRTGYVKVTKCSADTLWQDMTQAEDFAFWMDVDGSSVKGFSVALGSGRVAYIPWREEFFKFYAFFTNPKVRAVGYNLKETIKVLSRAGFTGAWENVSDVMLLAYLLQEGTDVSLERLVLVNLGEEIVVDAVQETLFEASLEETLLPREEKSCEVAEAILRLHKALQEKLHAVCDTQNKNKTLERVYQDIELPLVPILANMEIRGVQFDAVVFVDILEKVRAKIQKLEKRIYELAGGEFNINSTKQLRGVLFEKLKIATKDIKKTKTGYSTASSELEKLKGEYEIAKRIEEYRELFKLKTTYLDVLPELADSEGRVHTTFNQAVTATGRLSSSDPNLQNIPTRTDLGRMLRKAFVAREGYRLVSADYSQIDLRCAAHLSGDEKLIEAFHKGEDIHVATASEVYGTAVSCVTKEQRRQAKVMNFGVLYGMGAFGFMNASGLERKEAQSFIDAYMEKFSGLAKYLEDVKAYAKTNGYVETELGRRRYVPEINSTNFQVAGAGERMAVNLPIQGLAADIMKLAMIAVEKVVQEYGDRVRMILQIHDELIFEVEESLEQEVMGKIKNAMEQVYALQVPLLVDVVAGDCWGDL